MRAEEEAEHVTLDTLPDELLHLVIKASGGIGRCSWPLVPLFEAVKGLGCTKALFQQLHRLRPLVGVQSLAVVQRPAHGPWCVTLLYPGELTGAVLEQARQGRVRSISTSQLAPAVARRVVPELLGAGCSLLEFCLWEDNHRKQHCTWAATFGEAAVCSVVLRALDLGCCRLQGPLPELRLPALQFLRLDKQQLTGGLEPLQSCTALQELNLSENKLTGSLEPLRRCTALQELFLWMNELTGDLEPLRGCTALKELLLNLNHLTGGLGPLRSCTALGKLNLDYNELTGDLEPLRGLTALQELWLSNNHLTGDLEPLRGCTALGELRLSENELTGGLEPLRDCTELCLLSLEDNYLVLTDEDEVHFEDMLTPYCPPE